MATTDQIDVYYSHLITALGRSPGVDIVAVAHMVPNTLTFAPALNKLGHLVALLPKPKSIERPEYQTLSSQFRMLKLGREWAANGTDVAATLNAERPDPNRPLVLVDIGGYFASSANQIHAKLGNALLGILEGTENGVQKYELNRSTRGDYTIPLVTVARSPLKLPEDYLVASSIVFSVEATLRQNAEILQSRSAAVIGYGRVGSAIAEILRGRGISTVVYDTDPIKLAEAAARGFKAYRRREDALAAASLVVCATGNRALDLAGFGALTHGCVVASATSADDELDLSALRDGYRVEGIEGRLTLYRENRDGDRARFFQLVAGGDAANFLDGAVIGPAMQLIEGEKLGAIRALIDRRIPVTGGVSELTRTDRLKIADIWNHHFLQ